MNATNDHPAEWRGKQSAINLSLRDNQSPVLFFDGVCNFCNGSVQVILKMDKKGIFKFASLQSDAARQLLGPFDYPVENLQSVVLLHRGKVFLQTDVVVQILLLLGGGWKVLGGLLWLAPRFIRNPVYDWIARNRYKWFGRREECMVPTAEVRNRFLA